MRYKEKCHGRKIKSIVVRKNPTYHNQNFALVLDSNEIVDISYVESVKIKRKIVLIKLESESARAIPFPCMNLARTMAKIIFAIKL